MARKNDIAEIAVFDLGACAYVDELAYKVRHPLTGEETTWTITLAGPAHPATVEVEEVEFRKAQEEASERQVKAIAAIKANKKAPQYVETLEERRERNLRFIRARILGCSPARIDGEDIATAEDVRRVVALRKFDWLYTQLDNALSNKEGFIPNSATIS